MKEYDRLSDIETIIGSSLGEKSAHSTPPFEKIAGRIAAGEPAESFEDFFAGDIPAAPEKHAGRQSGNRRRSITVTAAGAAAAALLLFIGGGVLLGAVFGGTMQDAKSAEDAPEYEYCENYDSIAERTAGICEETDQECVSDSDLKDSAPNDSSDSSQ